MTKNLVIGFASNYEWKDLQYWVNSLQKTNYSGDIHIVSDNMKKETIEKLVSKNVQLSLYGKKNENGDFVAEQSIAPHVNRFFYIWNTLKKLNTDYRYVVTTDVRDVIFQSDPIYWLEENLVMHSLVASSEGLKSLGASFLEPNVTPYHFFSLRQLGFQGTAFLKHYYS